jgi:hypothetical protein
MKLEPIRAALPHWPRLMGVELAAEYLSISASTLRERGPPAKHLGRRALWDIRDLDRWADALAGQPLDAKQREEEGEDILRRVQERLSRGSN